MSRLNGKVAAVGVGYSKLERRSQRPLGLLVVDAIRAALDDCGLAIDDIDGLATFPEIPVFGNPQVDGIDVVTSNLACRLLGRIGAIRWYADGTDLIANTLIDAANAVAAGVCDTCVVFRAMHNPAGRYNAFTSDRAEGVRQFTAPYGMHRGYQYYGQAYARYMHLYGARREHMATLIVNNRENARLNPRAYFRDKPLTREDYLNSRMLADPVCLLDCDIPVDCAVAIVLTSAVRVRDLRRKPAYIAGFGQFVGGAGHFLSPQISLGVPLQHLQAGAANIASLMWESTGLRPQDVKLAQFYDGYSFFVYWWLEACGFCGLGEAFEFIQDGRIALGGKLPVNTFGGQLGEGRLHGVGHLAEAILQVSNRAGERQVPGADVCVAGVGPINDGSAAIAFTSEPG